MWPVPRAAVKSIFPSKAEGGKLETLSCSGFENCGNSAGAAAYHQDGSAAASPIHPFFLTLYCILYAQISHGYCPFFFFFLHCPPSPPPPSSPSILIFQISIFASLLFSLFFSVNLFSSLCSTQPLFLARALSRSLLPLR